MLNTNLHLPMFLKTEFRVYRVCEDEITEVYYHPGIKTSHVIHCCEPSGIVFRHMLDDAVKGETTDEIVFHFKMEQALKSIQESIYQNV